MSSFMDEDYVFENDLLTVAIESSISFLSDFKYLNAFHS
jgi:hydrogenase maturation factor HypE